MRSAAAPTHLTSVRNPLLKEIRKAVARGTMTADGNFIAETFHLLEEAIRSDAHIRTVVASESVQTAVERRVGGLRVPVITVPDAVFADLSATESNQGVMTLVRPRNWDLASVIRAQALVVVVDGIQDPGNAGAILRAAEAFGATGALYLKGSVNAYNPKAVRASAGSIFRLPFLSQIEPEIAAAGLQQHRLDIYAAAADGEKAVTDVDLKRRTAFIIGSEGRGVSSPMRAIARGLRIPVTQVESLNAAMAAGILLYEARRQRQLAP
jgi:RNA methyltransferase, TrmH family